jgi:hypothetical protein
LPLASRLLIVLLAATPALAIAHEAFAQQFTALAAAILLAMAAMGPQDDVSTAVKLLQRFSLALVFPFLWMTLQIASLPSSMPTNPIWSTAATALGESSLPGHISIDLGATIRSMVAYLTMLSLIVSTAIIARDRQRAETIFLVLSTVTTFMAAEVLIGQLDVFAGMIPSAGTAAATTFVAIALLSALANGAIIIMVIERYLGRRELENSSSAPLLFRLVLGLTGIAISLAAMRIMSPSSVVAAMMLGFSAIFSIAIFRRLGLRSWPSVISFALVAGIIAVAAVPQFQNASTGGIAAFANSATAESVALANRAMTDTPWLGNGVGAFRSLTPIYQDFGTAPVGEPPSTAVSIAIEWGLPGLAILIILALQLFIFTFRGAVRRGRDSFFASTAAASVLALLFQAFCDPSLLKFTVQSVAAVIVGLGLSQSMGRTSGLK